MRGRRSFLATVALGTTLAGCTRESPDSGAHDPPSTSTPTPLPPVAVPEALPNPSLGPADARVRVDYFGDFACPHCETYHEEAFGRLRTNYIDPGKIHYVRHDYPYVSHRSWALAGAARAVQHTVGEDAFWSFADEIHHANLTNASPAEIGRAAERTVGADPAIIERVVAEDAYRPLIERLHQSAEKQANFVPWIEVDGRVTIANYPSISGMIDLALEDE